MKDTPEKPILLVDDIPIRNTLGAAIVAASLASTFAKEPQYQFRYKCHPIMDRAWEPSKTLTPEEQRRKDEASLEAIGKAQAKRERKAMNRTVSTNQQTNKGL